MILELKTPDLDPKFFFLFYHSVGKFLAGTWGFDIWKLPRESETVKACFKKHPFHAKHRAMAGKMILKHQKKCL